MSYRDINGEPCPDRIIGDIGGAFSMGCIGGFMWHFGKNFVNSPYKQKLKNSFYCARTNAPVLGGSFAVWGGTFSAFDCISQKIRKKNDSLNSIYAGAATGGALALRSGLKSSARQALVGGVFLAVIEGMIFFFSKKTVMTPRDQYNHALKMEQNINQKKQRLNLVYRKVWSILSFPFQKQNIKSNKTKFNGSDKSFD